MWIEWNQHIIHWTHIRRQNAFTKYRPEFFFIFLLLRKYAVFFTDAISESAARIFFLILKILKFYVRSNVIPCTNHIIIFTWWIDEMSMNEYLSDFLTTDTKKLPNTEAKLFGYRTHTNIYLFDENRFSFSHKFNCFDCILSVPYFCESIFFLHFLKLFIQWFLSLIHRDIFFKMETHFNLLQFLSLDLFR